MIIASNLTESVMIDLSRYLWEQSIPMVIVRTYGLLGKVRLQFQELEILETRPDSDPLDLRIHNPFPELLVNKTSEKRTDKLI